MPAQIVVKYPDAKLKRIDTLLREFPKDVERFVPRAINRSIRTTRAVGARVIKRNVPKLKIGLIKKRMYEDKATRAAWRGKLSLSDSPISLRHFAYKQTKAGVPINIMGGRKIVKRAFKMSGGAGGGGDSPSVFVRNPLGEDMAFFDWAGGEVDNVEELEARLPITKLLGPSITDLYGEAPGVVARVTREASTTMNKNIDAAVDFALSRRMPK